MADENKQDPKKSTTIKEVELSGSEARAKLAELIGSMSTSQQTSHVKPSKEYKFWSTQPVPSMDSSKELEQLGDQGCEIETKTIEDVPKKPYTLIEAFEWTQIDVTNDSQLDEAYRLLNENYVEDGEAMFRFDYTRNFLRWALLPPGWHASWHIGVRVKSNKKLVALITAIPATLQVHKDEKQMAEINFLCVHKKLRAKRLAPVLIREITRRVNLQGIWQAVYTAGALLPRPVSSSRYYHRSLNPKKLIDIGFSRLQPRMTMARTIKLYALKSETCIPGIRELRPTDGEQACALFQEFSSKFNLHVNMSTEEFCHWFMPRKDVIHSYVVENPESGKLTDLVSFYSLPSSIIQHPVHKTLKAAYSYCTAALKNSITDLMRDALVLARRNDFDVFNALDLAQNAEMFKELKFHIGDGELNYYLYNWKCRPVPKEKNSLVML